MSNLEEQYYKNNFSKAFKDHDLRIVSKNEIGKYAKLKIFIQL